jgi:hypothetical protein
MLMSVVALGYSLTGSTRRIYLPGPTTNGHYQIELECSACHTAAFADRDAMQAACVRCHGAELRESNDSHPEKKFNDPRNADRVALLDARFCVTCHREHRPEQVSTMGLSLPVDYCYRCHQTIAEERPSHAGLGFESCANAGCHNFHDNRALYEDFLVKHLDEPELVVSGKNPSRTAGKSATQRLKIEKPDAPPPVVLSESERNAWAKSAHARGGVNCSGCHGMKTTGTWTDGVSDARCGDCHQAEHGGFMQGRHGMRSAIGLPALEVSQARLPMKPAASSRTLGCSSCHAAHGFETRRAAVQACAGCHDDQHTRSYFGSTHFRLWKDDATGQSGASCATCHMPRTVVKDRTRVRHNQNDNLRPNEKMARSVCLNCHGLGFTLDALADPTLVANNFTGRPAKRVHSPEMAKARRSAHTN